MMSRLRVCWFCDGRWGTCVCGWPEADTHPNDVPETLPGFDTGEMYITHPNVSECGRFFVNPIECYGAAFVEWVRTQPEVLARLSPMRLEEIYTYEGS
jgi:hypothetical protein